MSTSPVELDFFRMERERNRDKDRAAPISERKRSFCGIVSKLNPEIVKTVIQSLPVETHSPLNLKLHAPTFRQSYGRNSDNPETEQVTTFYNGKIFDFDHLFTHKEHADEEKVSKSAQVLNCKGPVISYEQDLLGTLEKGLPYARRISVKKFLEKRKERRILKRVSISDVV